MLYVRKHWKVFIMGKKKEMIMEENAEKIKEYLFELLQLKDQDNRGKIIKSLRNREIVKLGFQELKLSIPSIKEKSLGLCDINDHLRDSGSFALGLMQNAFNLYDKIKDFEPDLMSCIVIINRRPYYNEENWLQDLQIYNKIVEAGKHVFKTPLRAVAHCIKHGSEIKFVEHGIEYKCDSLKPYMEKIWQFYDLNSPPSIVQNGKEIYTEIYTDGIYRGVYFTSDDSKIVASFHIDKRTNGKRG